MPRPTTLGRLRLLRFGLHTPGNLNAGPGPGHLGRYWQRKAAPSANKGPPEPMGSGLGESGLRLRFG